MGYFDQIMVSQSLIQKDLPFRYWKPGFTTSLLIQTSGQYKAIRNGIPQPKLVLVTTFRFISID
jgi:hypothetical protein